MKTMITRDVDKVAEDLRSGNVDVVPTETVYGLAANALDESAVAKIYEIKQRPRFNPIIVHVRSAEEFAKYAAEVPEKALKLASEFSPGPVTFVMKKKDVIPDIVTAGNDSVGLRIPNHPLLLKLINTCGFPLAAPSANMFGRISPTSAAEAEKELGGKVSFILDGGNCCIGIESTVISFTEDEPVILRSGAVTREMAEKVIGKVKEAKGGKVLSPGMLESHYAPGKPLLIANARPPEEILADLDAEYMDLGRFGSLADIAVNLFSEMRRCDESDSKVIICMTVKNEGIGVAINDRLLRASSGNLGTESGSPAITRTKEMKHA
jgi:L-threonylcarbamoyladenylate synthase